MNDFAQNAKEARRRSERWKSHDPFPTIAPALLNSADITDYVRVTGMLHPFTPAGPKLKTASYEIDIGGEYLWWDSEGKKRQGTIRPNQPFILKKNSIAFVQVDAVFRLPPYIAVRFNLKITHVYRGLLLGTGPLIDPEYEGNLYIPLHNLTDNDYTLVGGEGLIWAEFTKLSVSEDWHSVGAEPERKGQVFHFPAAKTSKPLDYYIRKADPHRAIRSSIPVEVEKASAAARSAARSAWFATGAFILGLVALGMTVSSFVVTSMNFVNGRANTLEQKIEGLQHRLEDLEKRIPAMKP